MTVTNSYSTHRVVWSEGQLLSPQHFQQQERAIFNQIGSARKHLIPEFKGWSRLTIDVDALQRGVFSLTDAAGILPDGTLIDFPAHGKLPQSLPLLDSHMGEVICLALAKDGVGFNLAKEEPSWSDYSPLTSQNRHVRMIAQEQPLADESDPDSDPQHLLLGILCPRLCLQKDLWTDEVYLPLVRLRPGTKSDGFSIDSTFIPPLLDVRANAFLMSELESVIDLINYRVKWQIDRLNQPQTSSVLETTDFLLLQSLLRHETALRFELNLKPASPLATFRQLISLCSDLAACNYPPSHANVSIDWQSSNLGGTFSPILMFLKRQLTLMRQRLSINIEFKTTSDGTYVSIQSLPEIEHNSRIILAVQAQVPNDWLWQRFSQQAIVCASDRLADRVRLQLGGVSLTHLPAAPAELPLQAGWHYFEIEKNGLAWAELIQSKSLGIHVTGQWPGLSLLGWFVQSKTGQRETT
jgi:type VI secretion system protein ImpJ